MAETRLHRAHRERLARLRDATVRLVLAQDTFETPDFVAAAVPFVLDAQRATVAETDAYLSLEAGLLTGSDTSPLGVDADRVIGVDARRGELLEDVYARNHRAMVSTFPERIAREVNTDITLAQRATAWLHTEGDPRVIGWRRVVSASACTLCSVAATQTYRSSDLQPIHQHCSCTVAPIYGTGDPPDPRAIEPLYSRLGSASVALSEIPATATSPAVTIVDDVLGPTLVAA